MAARSIKIREYTHTRGRAYQCLRCRGFGKEVVGEKGRIVAHFYKHHVSLDKVPYYCNLCNFRCTQQRDLERHVRHYPDHKVAVQKLVERGQSVGQTHEESSLIENTQPYQWTEEDILILNKEESELVWRERSGCRMKMEGGSPVIVQPNLTVIGSATSKALAATSAPAVPCKPLTTIVPTANVSQNHGFIQMSTSANLNAQASTTSTRSDGPTSVMQASVESEDILNNLLNYEDDPFLSEFPTREKHQSYISEPTSNGGVIPSPVRQPMTKSDYVKSPKSMSSSASSTCSCCEEHKQDSQRMVEKFTVAVDAMNRSISLASQAVRGTLDVSLDALSNVTKALQEQAVAIQQYQKITNDLIKSINVRTLTDSAEFIGNQPVLKEDKGRNEERTDNKENKKSDRRRENSREKKHLRQERRHHPY
ncbi:hypothetical protein CHS0354_033336 [Potamilus streckersoni]|uniref:C2H2-type domain-containing protein n=1 Tax=Potamilus streckersoni TaxID=2493646 RepID=A0AAE0RTF2_9BIVA|nr:hypothetical protein CHS0354_033336 [Potamilus streckersoni]